MEQEREFDILLSEVKRICPFIPEGYKRSYISRRIRARMRILGIRSYGDYIAYIRKDPGEAPLLFDRLTINVTGFFRDMDVFRIIEEKVLPVIMELQEGPVRIWSAGSSDGREAYSLLLMIQNGYPGFLDSVRFIATDIDVSKLEEGKKGIYRYGQGRNISEEVPPNLLRSLSIDGNMVRIPDRLRRKVRFFKHDLLRDDPIPSQDLILCRNLLIYLPSRSQERVLKVLSGSLKKGGFLVLGKSEHLADSLIEEMELFDLQGRIFRKRLETGNFPQRSTLSREETKTDFVEG